MIFNHQSLKIGLWKRVEITEKWNLYNELDWLHESQLLLLINDSLNDLAPRYLESLFKRNSQCSIHSLRNTKTDLRVPKKISTNSQKCFSFRGTKLWNGLSAESKKASSLKTFKQTIWNRSKLNLFFNFN